ncbi:GlcG/HbpS family heme-binding protein [Bradyrhizobium australiense]|uniref:Heme-binding protein n=1 Tax=Bradyrhizobium australiense TaxID=2721161 RepID=A0A7Y4LTM9_9BRAD|nr:heme-binding protein [Bradyrhizobium australiense]NOJ38417.1 heme-binding protein [Bradyrhizobium australiense]
MLGTSFSSAQVPNNADGKPSCPVDHARLADILKKSVRPAGGPSNGGLDNNEWAAVVNRDGIVCAVAFSGNKADDQWPGSRAIAAEKANTANAFSLANKAMATANLYAQSQPGGYLFGAALSSPPNAAALYSGQPAQYGTSQDPLVGQPLGGVIAFGGGLALYDSNGPAGGLGVSGDSACADHNVAWRVRHLLGLDHVPAGVNPNMKDAIIYDIGPDGKSTSGFGHPKCDGKEDQIAVDLGAGVQGNAVR